jgi:DNA-sulfur modification-associated
MISVAAIRMQQFGVQFYQASLTANDIDKLVRFEVLSYGEQVQAPTRGGRKAPSQSKIKWDLLERRIASSEKAYQRHIIRRKIEELVQYYEQCRQARDLPSIPGAVIISADEKLSFEPVDSGSNVGRLKVPEREGILRAIDGQHRLLNAKHTRLNSSHLVSLSGRQLYRDEALAAAHDVVRALNDRPESPLYGEIKLLGVGRGRVAQAPLAQEFKKLFANEDALGGARKAEDFRDEAKKFFVNYLRQIATLFESAWQGRKYSIKSATALRAFIRVAPDVIQRIDQQHADRTDYRAIGRVIAPWGRRIGALRFETDGAWKRQGTTVEGLAKELKLALQYPEGAGV